jgi:2-aminoadipate transaminase
LPSKAAGKSTLKRPRAIVAERLSIELFKGSNRPLFVQVKEQIHDLIANGVLLPGMRLPPVRDLAKQLNVNQITVAKAYRELAVSSLIEGRRGGGSFVRSYGQQSPVTNRASDATPWPLLAERLFELSRAPGVISFSSNYPAVDHATVREFQQCVASITGDALESCFHYDAPLGRLDLRNQIQTYLANEGIDVDANNIMITSGGQQAIDLVARALASSASSVAIEQPSYYGAINAFRGVRARMLEVPLESDGIDLEVLERHLVRDRARVIYTNPTFQNPTGITMSKEKRQALLALARRFGAVILEDDHSHELRFTGADVPSIRSLAENEDLVLYTRGFGKTLLPGMRLGYVVMPDALRQKMLMVKSHVDLHCNNFVQDAVAKYFANEGYVKTLKRMRETYGAHQRRLYKSLVEGMPPGTTINKPEGGLSFWLTLPEGADVSELYFRAVRRGVAFVSGDVFYAMPSHPRSLRISFGLNPEGELEEGVQRLCSVVEDLLGRRTHRSLVMM